MDDILSILEDLWVIIAAIFSITTTYQRIKGQDVVTKRILPETLFVPELVGIAIGDNVAQQVNLPVSFLTTVPKVILRKAWGPPGATNLNAQGFYGDATQVLALAGAAFLLAPMLGPLATWEYGFESPKALGWVVPDSATVTKVPGTLRRRRFGRGS
jgi:hypothetical protein